MAWLQIRSRSFVAFVAQFDRPCCLAAALASSAVASCSTFACFASCFGPSFAIHPFAIVDIAETVTQAIQRPFAVLRLRHRSCPYLKI